MLEVRAGTGGGEATLFAAEIFRMYCRYAEAKGWKVEITAQSDSEIGGIKEAIALVTGNRVYSKLKHESGRSPASSACPRPRRRAASTLRR